MRCAYGEIKMNSRILELICYPFVVGFFIGYCLIIILYKSYIAKSEKTICPICKKAIQTNGVFKNPLDIFYHNGKIMYTHQGQCAIRFLHIRNAQRKIKC